MADIKYIDLKDSDLVEFHIYPDLSKYSDRTDFNFVNELLCQINEIVSNLSENYIWHNDEFEISPKNFISSFQTGEAFKDVEAFSFYGCLDFSENVEDEWFLVYILVELTKQMEDLIICVKDGDGEFLLIETAEELPKWVTPETSEGRTFLYKGLLHILPVSYKLDKGELKITEKVLKYLRENAEKTKCDVAVQKIIHDRIAKFPNCIEENFHKSVLYLPVGVASLLKENQKFIAPAVRAFNDRDLFDIKACRAMRYFPPENRVYTRVKFTKLLYVMLSTSKFIPDKRTGWNLPHPNDENYKSHLLGVKLACGFEILMNQAKANNDNGESEESNIQNDPNWRKFLKSLQEKNYFRGLLENSKQYCELYDNAKKFYINSCGKSSKSTKAQEILNVLNKIEIDIDQLKSEESNLPKSDDDSWINITQKELDALLEARFGREKEKFAETKDNCFEISNRLHDFINHKSGIDGAEFPQKSKGSRNLAKASGTSKKRKTVKFSPDTKNSEISVVESNSDPNSIKFEAEGFLNAIQNILDFSIPDDNYWDSDGSGMSSYEDESDFDLGESFKSNSTNKDKELIEYMEEMDKELSETTLGKSFVTKNISVNENINENGNVKDNKEFEGVDVDINAFKNIISSYKAQMGNPGPAENLLGPLGVNLNDYENEVD